MIRLPHFPLLQCLYVCLRVILPNWAVDSLVRRLEKQRGAPQHAISAWSSSKGKKLGAAPLDIICGQYHQCGTIYRQEWERSLRAYASSCQARYSLYYFQLQHVRRTRVADFPSGFWGGVVAFIKCSHTPRRGKVGKPRNSVCRAPLYGRPAAKVPVAIRGVHSHSAKPSPCLCCLSCRYLKGWFPQP